MTDHGTNGNGTSAAAVDAAAAPATFRRRAEDHEETRIRNLAFSEFQRRRSGASPAEAYFASLDVYRRELCYIALRRVTTGGART